MKRIFAVILTLTGTVCVFCSCSLWKHVYASTDLMEGIEGKNVSCGDALDNVSTLTDFACNLFANTVSEGKSTLVSPVSVLYALAMTANGAKGETLAEMQATLGMDVDTLNKVLLAYSAEIAKTDELALANAIWFKDDSDFTVDRNFLQTNADYYKAGAYLAPFDQTTLADINAFVEEHTKGRVKDILDEIPNEAVMYLVNALAFESTWAEKFGSSYDDTFNSYNGEVTKKFMAGSAVYMYDDTCIGAKKNYKNSGYSFVALLPEDNDVTAFAKTLTASKLQSLVTKAQGSANLQMPKFTTDYDVLLNDVLKNMGIRLAFDADFADLTGLGTVVPPYNLAITRVLHKTHLELDNEGTKASAATIVEIGKCTSAGPMDEPKLVLLNRPFVYAIWDNVNQIPVFLGTYLGD